MKRMASYGMAGALALGLIMLGMGAAEARAQGQPPWTPAELATDLAFWLDASDETTITHNNGSVEQWNDKSGNNRHVSQATADQQPTYASSTVSFDGSNDLLFNNSSFMYANGSIDIYIVASAATTADRRFLGEILSTSNTAIYLPAQTRAGAGSTMGAMIRNDANSIRLANNVSLSAAGAFDPAVTKIYQWRDTGSQMYGRVNGGSPTAASYSRAEPMPLDSFGVGGIPPRPNSAPGSAFIAADIKEVVITQVLSEDDREAVEGYLAWKWGLESGLPADHTYSASQPLVTVWSAPSVSAVSGSTAQASAVTDTALSESWLAWAMTDLGTAGHPTDWPNRVSLGAQAADATISGQMTGLAADTWYTLRFFGVQNSLSDWSNPATFASALSAAQKPVFTSTDSTMTAVSLAWTDNAATETGYVLRRAVGSSGAFDVIDELPANTTSYLDTGLEPRTTYVYQLAAVNSVNESQTAFEDCQVSVKTQSAPAFRCQLGVLTPETLGGLNPATGEPWKVGDPYHLTYITTGETVATSTDIADYNTFVSNDADSEGMGAAAWFVMGSTTAVHAINNAVITGPIINVFNNGVSATGAADFYNLDFSASANPTTLTGGGKNLHTGTQGGGTTHGGHELGAVNGAVRIAWSGWTNWAAAWRAESTSSLKSLLAISEELKIQAPAATIIAVR